LDSRVSRSIGLFRLFLDSTDRPVYLLFSGGRDSMAVLALSSMLPERYIRRLTVVYVNLVGNTAEVNRRVAIEAARRLGYRDHIVVECRRDPCTMDIEPPEAGFIEIRAYSRNGLPFHEALRAYGPPVSVKPHGLWCRREYKLYKVMYLPVWPKVLYSVMGMRRSESTRRAGRVGGPLFTNILRRGRHARLQVSLLPIWDWGGGDVERVVEEAGLGDLLEPYRVAGDSLNCIFCPFKTYDKALRTLKALVERPDWGLDAAVELCRALEGLRPTPGTRSFGVVEEWRRACREAGLSNS